MTRPSPLPRRLLLALPLALSASLAFGQAGDGESGAEYGPRDEPVDVFHPDRDTAATPAYGGTVSILLFGLPSGVNRAVENSSYTRRMLYELHAYLAQRDWEHWNFEPMVAASWVMEDTLILVGGRGDDNTNILYGSVTEDGDHYVVTPVSSGNPLTEARRVPKADVESLQRETVITWRLRDDVKWHDGHAFDARDAFFSWQVYKNPSVDCEALRPYFDRIVHAEIVDDLTVRYFAGEQYFKLLETVAEMHLLPSHLYDLLDPDHAQHDPAADLEARAAIVNENPHNTQFVGLGPYKLETWSQQVIVANRFPDYFDPEDGGYFDTIRWRHLQNTETQFQAAINGELDFTDRLSSDQYFGEATQAEAFTERLYKGYHYTGGFNYSPFNMRRPFFADIRVRKAFTHAFDIETYRQTIAHGLAKLPTGPQFYFGNAYDHSVERLPYDPDRAEELLAEAGWYDRDGDGIIDKDGVPFEITFLMISGNKASELYAQTLQESVARLGIKMNLTGLEWASFLERVYDRDFDITGLSWAQPLESDPVQLWHSSGAPEGVRSSNHAGVADPRVDELIAAGQRELDDEKRHAIWKELHRYLYDEVHAYLYRLAPPKKFAISRSIRGFQSFKIDPGYSIRRWYYPAGTPGTRATRTAD